MVDSYLRLVVRVAKLESTHFYAALSVCSCPSIYTIHENECVEAFSVFLGLFVIKSDKYC